MNTLTKALFTILSVHAKIHKSINSLNLSEKKHSIKDDAKKDVQKKLIYTDLLAKHIKKINF